MVRGPQTAVGFGATTAGGQEVPNEDTLFQVGSISKVISGLALARLALDTWTPPDSPGYERL